MKLHPSSPGQPRASVRIVMWLIATVASASWFAFAGGASTVFLILTLTGALIVEAVFWVVVFRRAFRPWKPAAPTIRFAKGG